MNSAFHGFPTADGAEFLGDRRLLLWRSWDDAKPLLGFIGLNPSKADAKRTDPTTTRNGIRARREGFGGIVMGNIYDFVSPYPSDLRRAGFPISPENFAALDRLATLCSEVVMAPGAHAQEKDFWALVVRFGQLPKPPRLRHLGILKGGLPRHPLHTAYAVPLQDFSLDQCRTETIK